MNAGTSIAPSTVDSDYGTWSSTSSDRCSELQNLMSDTDSSYNFQFNTVNSTICSCCDAPSELGYSANDAQQEIAKVARHEYPRNRTRKWRGIRMGVTIDYNAIKAHVDKCKRRQMAQTQAICGESSMADSSACAYQLASTTLDSENLSMSRFDTSDKKDCWPEAQGSPLDTNKSYSEDRKHVGTLEYSFATETDSPSDADLNLSRTFQIPPVRTSYARRRIPQEIINNAKIVKCKVAIIGSGKTGKSTLAKRQFLNDVFFGESEDEAESVIKGHSNRSNEGIASSFMIEFIDSENDEQNILRADAILLVYSVTDKKSFTDILRLYYAIMAAKKHSMPIVLVGTKADVDKKKRRVTAFEGQSLARRLNCPFLEVSAKTNDQVHEAFVELMRLVDKHQARLRRLKRSLAPVLL